MFYDFFYNFAIISSVGVLTYAVASICCGEKKTKEFLSIAVWNTSNGIMYAKRKTEKTIEMVNDYLEQMKEKKTIIDDNGKEKIIEVNKIYTFHEIDNMSKLKKLSLNFYECMEYKFNNKSTYYIQLHKARDKKNLYKKIIQSEFNKVNTECKLLEYIQREQIIEKPFIHVTLNINDEKKDIHEYLDKYYVDGNEILTFKFLKWYLKYYYNTQLTEPYTIDILDDKIQMIKLQQNQGIYIKNNTYEIYDVKQNGNVDILDTV